MAQKQQRTALALLCLFLSFLCAASLPAQAPQSVTLTPLTQYTYEYTARASPKHSPETLVRATLSLAALAPARIPGALPGADGVAILAHARLDGEMLAGRGGFSAEGGGDGARGDLAAAAQTAAVRASGWFFYSPEGEVLRVKVDCADGAWSAVNAGARAERRPRRGE